MKTKIFYFLLGAIVFSSITAIAVTKINANEISYTDKNDEVITVEEALNNLYTTAANYSNCIGGYWTPTSGILTNTGDIIENVLAPEFFTLRRLTSSDHTIVWAKERDETTRYVQNGSVLSNFSSIFTITEHGLIARNWNGGVGEKYYYVACN